MTPSLTSAGRLSPKFRLFLRRIIHPAWFGTLRRTRPFSEGWGYERGTPVDRFYIESFLNRYRQDIGGRVLEVKDSTYTERFGTGVTERAVLDIDPTNPQATVIADLTAADNVASDQYDCFILTQTLQFIYDVSAAIRQAHRILRPGGSLLATVPVISRLDRRLHTDYWRFTAASCRALFAPVFGSEQVNVEAFGNVLASIAFLEGLGYEELSLNELQAQDERCPLIVTIRAVKLK